MASITVTAKNQITLPIALINALGIKKGQKLIVEQRQSSIILTPAEKFVYDLSGSLKTSTHIRDAKALDTAIDTSFAQGFTIKE